MAKHNILLALASFALLLAISAHARQQATAPLPGIANSHLASAAPSPNDDDGEYALAPEPYPGFFAFVDTCLAKLTEKCGKQIFSAIFEKGDVSNRCCGELVVMGKRCHSEIIKATIILPFVTEEMKEDFEKQDVQVWSKCVSSIAS